MRNIVLHLLVNPDKDWSPSWALLARDPGFHRREESPVEAAVRDALQLRDGKSWHIIPLLVALERHEWSRWIVRDDDRTYRFEWYAPPATVWENLRIVPQGGKTVWPPTSSSLPLIDWVSFRREGLSSLRAEFSNGVVTDFPCEFRGNVAVVEQPTLHGRLILSSGEWADAGIGCGAEFTPTSYPWSAVSDNLDSIPGHLDFLNLGGTLATWNNSASPVEKVACYAAALITLGLK